MGPTGLRSFAIMLTQQFYLLLIRRKSSVSCCYIAQEHAAATAVSLANVTHQAKAHPQGEGRLRTGHTAAATAVMQVLEPAAGLKELPQILYAYDL